MDKYQNPDYLVITKQRDESGYFKWHICTCKRYWKEDNLTIIYDVTNHYTRVIWEENKVPLYTAWEHILWDIIT